jgi:hypothetical protein
MGDHFETNAKTAPGGPYGYAARTPAYVARKLKRYGHNRPWYRTGYSSRFIYSNSRVRATQYRSTLEIRAPFPLKEQARKELEAITPDEQQDARELCRAGFIRRANDPKNKQRRTRRIT